jgi:hypothetical protein
MKQSENTGANQYGFYAVPKALEPKTKYRDNYEEDEYADENDQDNNDDKFIPIDDKEP